MEAEAFETQLEHDELLACRVAFEQTTGPMAGTPGHLDTGDFRPVQAPPEDVFMSDCLRLPRLGPAVQGVLVFCGALPGMHRRTPCPRRASAVGGGAAWRASCAAFTSPPLARG